MRDLIGSFVVIGEAINALLGDPAEGCSPAAIIGRHPAVDWKGYAALPHILAHQYFRREPSRTWAAGETELPALRKAIADDLAGPA